MLSHPIKIAVHRTGLNSHTIRIWEKRYGAVTPARSATNRRLYSDADITRLQLLQQATQSGHSIGQIARMPDASLRQLVLDSQVSPSVTTAPQLDATPYIDQALQSIRQLDAAALEGGLVRASLDLGHAQLIEQVIEPLMRRVGELWHEGSLRIADEHLASSVVRRFVDGIRMGLQPALDAPHIIVTTPTGQLHEIGAVLVSTLAAAAHWRVTYMGANLPADDIAVAAHHNDARAVALSIVYPLDDPYLGRELIKLRQALGDDIYLFVGGRAVPSYSHILKRIDAIELNKLSDLRPHLHELQLAETRR